MNPAGLSLPEFDDLVDRLFSGTLSHDEAIHLESQLLADEVLRGRYRDAVALHVMLSAHSAVVPLQHLEMLDEVDVTSLLSEDDAVNLVSSDRREYPPSRVAFSMRFLSIAVSLVLVGYFVALGGLLAWDRFQRSQHRSLAAKEETAASFATITDDTDCEWAELPPPRGVPFMHRLLQLKKGSAQLTFARGAKVVVEAPAEFEVRSEKEGFLKYGSALASVPRSAIGFTVETPAAQIVDLGTEFAVAVDDSGATDVQVIVGKVDVRYDASVKDGPSRRSLQIGAGSARRFSSRVGSDGIAIVPIAPWIDQAAVHKKIARTIKKLPTEVDYAAAVLADKPLGYWRFSDNGRQPAVDASGNDHHGIYHDTVSTSNAGICPDTDDQSLRFLGPKYEGSVEIAGFELPASYTIEMWARSATPHWSATGWLLSSKDTHEIIVAPLIGTLQWQFFVSSTDGYHHLGTHAPNEIADRFHQYVCAYDADKDRAWMYFDGTMVNESSQAVGSQRRQVPRKLTLHVGRDCRMGSERCGEGWMDELAIYSGVLSAEAVKRHFDAAELKMLPAPSSERN